jgi:hypothetical protein
MTARDGLVVHFARPLAIRNAISPTFGLEFAFVLARIRE